MPNLNNVTAPILIIGPGRSGSSWLMHILNKHPDMRVLIENTVLKGMYEEIFQSWWAEGWHWECDDPEREQRAIRATRMALCELFPDDRPRWAMKMIWRGHPWPFAHKVFPDAKYIHLTRDPTTALLSMSEYLGRRNSAWRNLRYSETEYVEAHREALKVSESGLPYLRIRQEDAAVDPHRVWEQVREFCNLSQAAVSNLEIEINTSPSTAGKVKDQRKPLPWKRLSPDTLQISQELGYLPAGQVIPDIEPVGEDEGSNRQAGKQSKAQNASSGPVDVHHKSLETQLLQLRQEIETMKATKGWRLLETYWRKRDQVKGVIATLLGKNGRSERRSAGQK